jgi:hypothetical protein
MKRFLYGVIVLVVLAVGIGFFLPSNRLKSFTANATIPFDGISRVIVNKQYWEKWWPGTVRNDSTLAFGDTELHIDMLLLNGFKASVLNKNLPIFLELQTIATYNAETALTLNVEFNFSKNPLTKLYQYISYSSQQKQYEELFKNLTLSFSNVKRVYGFDIRMEKVPNAYYVSIKNYLNHYPTIEEVYTSIEEAKNFILSQKCKVVNYPIFNVFKEGESQYLLMVAVASDREIPSQGKFLQKNMMLGNIVVAGVQGGNSTIEKCKEAVQFYVNDFRKVSPAIAFERLITNRLQEKDSSKWITTINYPVFQ